MKGLVKGLAVAGLVLAFGAGSAQAQSSIGGFGGLTIPTGTLSDGLKTGWHLGALYRFKPAASPVGFQIDGMYQRNSFKAPGDGNQQIYNGTANVVFAFPTAASSAFKPYLIGGVGVYNIKVTDNTLNASGSVTKFGVNAGAGFDIKFGPSPAVLFVEGRFHNVFTEGTNARLIPISAGVRLGF